MFSARFTVMMISFFCLFIVFLYGPMFCILVLSFQGPEGGLTFPMRGLSMFWFQSLFDGVGVIDIWSSFGRSLRLGIVVMVLTIKSVVEDEPSFLDNAILAIIIGFALYYLIKKYA